MIIRGLTKYICDDCGVIHYDVSDSKVREKGWAIGRDRNRCYCPECAPWRRNVGSAGRKRKWLYT